MRGHLAPCAGRAKRDRPRRREIEGVRNTLYHLFVLRDQLF